MTHLPWTTFFGTNHYYYFHLPLGLLHSAKFKKNLTGNSGGAPGIMGVHHFWAQNGPFALPNFFLENYQYQSHPLVSPFHGAKLLKNSSSRSRVMRMCNFWTQNGPYPLMRSFSENLLMGIVSFIYAYLHAKNQSQITLLVKYCQLKNAEVSLVKSHFWLWLENQHAVFAEC